MKLPKKQNDNSIKSQILNRKKTIKALGYDPELKSIDGTLYGDIKAVLNKKRINRVIPEQILKGKALKWIKKVNAVYGEEGNEKWKTFIAEIKNISESPQQYTSIQSFQRLSEALISFPKMLISIDMED